MKKLSALVVLALLVGCAPAPEEVPETHASTKSADTDCTFCALRDDGHVVIEHVPDAAHLEQIVRDIPDGGWTAGNSFYAALEDTKAVYFKSWLYLIRITAWQKDNGRVRPDRGRIVGYRTRNAADWVFSDNLDAPPTSTAVILGTWETEAKNALSMKWIPSQLPLGAVVLPSKQTFISNFFPGDVAPPATQVVAYAGLIACANALKSDENLPGYDDAWEFDNIYPCDDAKKDRDQVLNTYRAEVGDWQGDPKVVVGISAGTFIAQQLGAKLGGVETHLFGTPRYACKGGNPVGCDDGDVYATEDADQPYCENGPNLFGNAFYRNNPHDRVPGSFFDNLAVLKANHWHDYSNWTYADVSGADRFHRTEYLACDYGVQNGGHPDCAHFPFDFGTCTGG